MYVELMAVTPTNDTSFPMQRVNGPNLTIADITKRATFVNLITCSQCVCSVCIFRHRCVPSKLGYNSLWHIYPLIQRCESFNYQELTVVFYLIFKLKYIHNRENSFCIVSRWRPACHTILLNAHHTNKAVYLTRHISHFGLIAHHVSVYKTDWTVYSTGFVRVYKWQKQKPYTE